MSDHKTIALLPCPFCGGAATLNASGLFDMNYQVMCDICYAATGHCKNADKIKEVWNTRHDPVKAELLEALKEAEAYIYRTEINNAGHDENEILVQARASIAKAEGKQP